LLHNFAAARTVQIQAFGTPILFLTKLTGSPYKWNTIPNKRTDIPFILYNWSRQQAGGHKAPHGRCRFIKEVFIMRVFVTGATGFIGSYLVPELIQAGYHVVGLTRSDAGADALMRAGAEVFRGDVNDLDRLRTAAGAADGVIHAAFNHDFSNLKQHSEEDRKVIETLGQALAGSARPLVVTSGTGLARRSNGGGPALETDLHVNSAEFARAATEEAADKVADKGGHVVVMRLSQVHDTRHQGRIALHIKLAQEKGRVAYVDEGKNRLAAVHVTDTARLFRLALENGRSGARYNAVGEEGVALRDIAEVIGSGLRLPVESITPDEAKEYFGWFADLAQTDLSASSALTREQLGWATTGPDLLTDLCEMDYDAL
jgi:nucleoside-diphosphate-sugar epimerase